MTTITDKINISAGAIRAAYRLNQENAIQLAIKLNVPLTDSTFDAITAEQTWIELSRTHPNKICGAFYHEATERQATRVINKAVREFKKR